MHALHGELLKFERQINRIQWSRGLEHWVVTRMLGSTAKEHVAANKSIEVTVPKVE